MGMPAELSCWKTLQGAASLSNSGCSLPATLCTPAFKTRGQYNELQQVGHRRCPVHAWLHSAAGSGWSANWAVECGAIKACKDLPVSQSQGKWVSRAGKGGDGGFMEIKFKDQRFVEVKDQGGQDDDNLQEKDELLSSSSPRGDGFMEIMMVSTISILDFSSISCFIK